MYDIDKANSQGKALLDLQTDWDSLIRERAGSRQGTTLRSELDTIYFKLLPLITAISNTVDESELDRLIQIARNQLKQREHINHE